MNWKRIIMGVSRRYENVKLFDGTIVNIIIHSREGFKSPDLMLYEVNGKIITPFEQRVRKWSSPTLNWFFKRIYGHLIEKLLAPTSLLNKITKDDNWKGGSMFIPFKK